MQRFLTACAVIFILGVTCVPAQAGWIIDAQRFHTSVHGTLSCQDCHSGIAEKDRHPDPLNVSKTLKDFFDPETCMACHDDIQDEIDNGSHAGQDVTSWQRFDDCIDCHNPHYEKGGEPAISSSDAGRTDGENCSSCHALQPKLPMLMEDDRACGQCHVAFPDGDARGLKETASVCLSCHGTDHQNPQHIYDTQALIDMTQYEATPHAQIRCITCHPQAMAFKHDQQVPGDCTGCHHRHNEKVANEAHTSVTCGACHLKGVDPVRNIDDGLVGWTATRQGRLTGIHEMLLPEKMSSCRNCHRKGNAVGAAAMLLPPKSIICMPCHTATFSAGDTITILSLLLFAAGLVSVGSIWFSAGERAPGMGEKILRTVRALSKAIASGRFLSALKSLLLDGVLQQRLFRVSRERWLWHALVFYPFVFRFTWGLAALCASLFAPGWPGTQALVDKNAPAAAFLFDLSGCMVILGCAGIILNRKTGGNRATATNLPRADWPAYGLLGGIIAIGFILEGMRMAMTGSPGGASYAFVGDAVSRLLGGMEMTGIYGYVWYLHAALTGAFIVYLPFSGMFHMIVAPLNMAIASAAEKRH